MRTTRRILFPLVLAASACSAADGSHDEATVRQVLDSTLASHARHFQHASIDSLVDAYTDSVVVRPQNVETVRGHEALRTTLAGWLKAAPIKTIAYTTEELAVHGDTAFHIASYKATLQPPGSVELIDNGRCTLLWLRDRRAAWRIHRSMCNSGAPPRPDG
jgi:ketosteroid isomerase-like protein